MKNGIFTVDQVADMLGLHPKTVRRFIREGKLNARKAGGHWRIMEHDIKLFMGDETVSNLEQAHDVNDSISGMKRNIKTQKVQVSSIVDVFVENKDEASRLSTTILAAMNSRDPEHGNARCDFLFYEDELKARFILWGTPTFMSTMLSLIAAITT